MVEINPVPIICQAREYKRPIVFSFHELDYVIHHSSLDNIEKLIWWLLAVETHRDPQLACLLSYQQFAYTLQMDHYTIHRALHRLVRMSFIQVNSLPDINKTDFTEEDISSLRLFMLSLPYEGLLLLKKSPSYKPTQAFQQGIFRQLPTLGRVLNKKNSPNNNDC